MNVMYCISTEKKFQNVNIRQHQKQSSKINPARIASHAACVRTRARMRAQQRAYMTMRIHMRTQQSTTQPTSSTMQDTGAHRAPYDGSSTLIASPLPLPLSFTPFPPSLLHLAKYASTASSARALSSAHASLGSSFVLIASNTPVFRLLISLR